MRFLALAIGAIHHDLRGFLRKHDGGDCVDLIVRQMQRSGKMLCDVVLFGQCLDQYGTVYSAAIKELFEDQIAEREAAQMGEILRRILDAKHDRIGGD